MSGPQRKAQPRSGPRSGPAPRPVTRGESRQAGESRQHARVDWIHATFDGSAISHTELIRTLSRVMDRPVRGLGSHGRFGFTERLDLEAGVGSRHVSIGCIAFGGDAQRGRVMLQLTGSGCGLVEDWDALQAVLDDIGAKLTRLDLAVDFLAGEVKVDQVVEWYRDGGFSCGGNRPGCAVAGDWINGEAGRTFYVGRAANGKLLRAYEKGLQLGQPESEWVRLEVQFGSRDRVIPLRALTDRDAFFAGAYPCLQALVETAAERIPTDQAQAVATMGHMLHHLRRCYGRVLDTALSSFGWDVSELVESVRVVGIPRRLQPAAAESGAELAALLPAIKRKQA